ncbi:MAG TPA: DUF4760 domain-containing protein [Actinomycetota bacterium]|nr:DUF4760 domain-containing protein [Actinomycetota bacterium]
MASYRTSGDLRDAIDRFHRTNDDRYYVLMRVPNFLEDLAVLVDQGALPEEAARASWASVIERQWAHWAPAIRLLRDVRDRPTIYANFERLKARMLRVDGVVAGDVEG